MKAIRQLIDYFNARNRLTKEQLDLLTKKGYWSINTVRDFRSMERNIGQPFYMEVTGRIGGSCYGTDIYTSDSQIEVVCVHAGILKPGETKTVKVTFVSPVSNFKGSERNGVRSSSWSSSYGSYKVESMD